MVRAGGQGGVGDGGALGGVVGIQEGGDVQATAGGSVCQVVRCAPGVLASHAAGCVPTERTCDASGDVRLL